MFNKKQTFVIWGMLTAVAILLSACAGLVWGDGGAPSNPLGEHWDMTLGWVDTPEADAYPVMIPTPTPRPTKTPVPTPYPTFTPTPFPTPAEPEHYAECRRGEKAASQMGAIYWMHSTTGAGFSYEVYWDAVTQCINDGFKIPVYIQYEQGAYNWLPRLQLNERKSFQDRDEWGHTACLLAYEVQERRGVRAGLAVLEWLGYDSDYAYVCINNGFY